MTQNIFQKNKSNIYCVFLPASATGLASLRMTLQSPSYPAKTTTTKIKIIFKMWSPLVRRYLLYTLFGLYFSYHIQSVAKVYYIQGVIVPVLCHQVKACVSNVQGSNLGCFVCCQNFWFVQYSWPRMLFNIYLGHTESK